MTLESGIQQERAVLLQFALDLRLGAALAAASAQLRTMDASTSFMSTLREAAASPIVRAVVDTILLCLFRNACSTDDAKALREYVRYGPQPNGGIIHAPPHLSVYEARTHAPPAQVASLLLLWLALLPTELTATIMNSVIWAVLGGGAMRPAECDTNNLHTLTPTVIALLQHCHTVLRSLQSPEPHQLFCQDPDDTEYMNEVGYAEFATFPFEDAASAFVDMRKRRVHVDMHLRQGWVAIPLGLLAKNMRAQLAFDGIPNLYEAELCRVVLVTGYVLRRATVAAVDILRVTDLQHLNLISQAPELAWTQVMLGRLPTYATPLPLSVAPKQESGMRMQHTLTPGVPSKGWRGGGPRSSTLAFVARMMDLHKGDASNGSDPLLLGRLEEAFAQTFPPCIHAVISDVRIPNSSQPNTSRQFKLRRKLFVMGALRRIGMSEHDATWILEVLLKRSKPNDGFRNAGDRFPWLWRREIDPAQAQSCMSIQKDPLLVCPWAAKTDGLQSLRHYARSGVHDIPDLEDMFAEAQNGVSCGRACTHLQQRYVMREDLPDASYMSPMRWTHRSV